MHYTADNLIQSVVALAKQNKGTEPDYIIEIANGYFAGTKLVLNQEKKRKYPVRSIVMCYSTFDKINLGQPSGEGAQNRSEIGGYKIFQCSHTECRDFHLGLQAELSQSASGRRT